MITGSQSRQLLAHLDVALVWRDHEAGVGERGDLRLDPFDQLGGSVADRRHRDAGSHIDQRVSVDVHQDAATASRDENRQHIADPDRNGGVAALEQVL